MNFAKNPGGIFHQTRRIYIGYNETYERNIMSENKEKTYTNSFAKEMATQAVTSAVVSAAAVLGTYAAFAAVGWYLQKKDKSNN
jgi:hypothetical protein